MLKTRKKKHTDYIADRIHEIHREIMTLVIHSDRIPVAEVNKKKRLLHKYHKRYKLVIL